MKKSALSFIRLKAQFIKEILSILRDPRSRMVIFVPPIMQLVIFAFAASLEVRNVDIAVNNQDSGKWSTEFVSQVANASFVKNVFYIDDKNKARDLLDQGKVMAILTIPVDFSSKVILGDTANIQATIDGRRSNSGQITVSYLNSIALEVNAATNIDVIDTNNIPVVVRHWFNPNLNHRWFIVPGLTGILALFSSLMITSLSIARERELGTFEQLMVSPTATIEIIISKSMPALIIGTILGLLMVGAGVFIFKIPFTGLFTLLVLSLMLFILSVVGIGLMISAISMTQQQAILGAFAVGVPAVLVSGFATPVENMPVVLQWIAQIIPLTHFLVIAEGSFLKAMPASDVLNNLWPLALIAIISLAVATYFVRQRLQ